MGSRAFGWTGRRAEWIALACLHGGVFTRAQWTSFLGHGVRRLAGRHEAQRRAVEACAQASGSGADAAHRHMADGSARGGAIPMRSLRLVPYWSVHETLGVDAHNAPLKMRTRRIHLSRAVAWSCVRRHPVAGAALGSTDVEGSDPPGRGPATGAGPCVFSHAGPAPWGVTPLQISLAGRPPSAAEDAADQFPGQPPVELWGIAEQDRGRLAVAQLTPPRDRPLHHRRDPLPQPASPPDTSRSRLETAPQHLRGRLLNVGTELRSGPGITARTGHLAAGQRRLPTRPNGFVDVSTWRSRRAELNREPLSHEEWSG